MAKEAESQAPIATKPAPATQPRQDSDQLPPFNVVLLDDDDHTYEYVIEMLGSVCSHSPQKAFTLAKEVDEQGRVIVLTTHKELAELKREQIQSFGIDKRIARCKGGMTAVIEPAN